MESLSLEWYDFRFLENFSGYQNPFLSHDLLYGMVL